MKQLLLNIAKVFLILLVCSLVVLISFGVVLGLDWPWWTGFFILLGLVGLFIGFLFLKKMLTRKHEQQFVNQIVEQDNRRLKSLSDKEKQQSAALQERWKEAVETLRQSHLRKLGNPLYVLPWYMVIGESGSGKTTAIKSARLSSPFAGEIQASGISGTKNCDWWFFDEAVIIDTAGRYAIPVDEGRDKDEWNKFLNLLVKYRKKEPLNGLIISVAADKLLEGTSQVLEQDGIHIRRRIDELMLALGAKFPIYVLVTKCDLIQGMTQFCEHLPDNALSQPMGSINEAFSADVGAFQNKVMDSLGERLRQLRLLLLHENKNETADPGLLLFPEEFERLRPGLAAFLQGLSQENPYQETPLMRGLFFSSGRQEGTPYSHFLKSLGLIEEKEVLPGTNKGLFLHDFFAKILPSDRGIFAPTMKALEWSKLTRNLGLTSWVALAIAVCGLLSFSFVKNLSTLRGVSGEFKTPPVLKGEILADLGVLSRFEMAIAKVEKRNEGWWMPRFGLDASEGVESRLKEKYCMQFRKGFMRPLDALLTKQMAGFSTRTDGEVLSRNIAYLVRKINLLHSRLQGADIQALGNMPVPPYEAVMFQGDQNLVPEIKGKLAQLYLYYLIWNSDATTINKEMTDLQEWLAHIVQLKDSDLRWLVSWANNQEKLPSVTLEDFWGGTNPVEDTATVQPAFTRAGRKAIDDFVKELESALPDPGPPMIARQKIAFETWYQTRYLESWQQFGAGFSAGVGRLKQQDERQQIVAKASENGGPYFALLDRMASELQDYTTVKDLPPWVERVFDFQELKAQAAQIKSMKNKSAIGKVLPKGKRLISTIKRTLRASGKSNTMEAQLKGGKAFLAYQEALKQLGPVSESRKVAYEEAVKLFGEDPVTGKSSFFAANQSISRIKTLIGTGKEGEKMYWALFAGPLNLIRDFVISETACFLQARWEKDVLVEVQGIHDQRRLQKILLGEGGLSTRFVKDPAAPFLSRSLKKGYYPKPALDGHIPFSEPFLKFLTKGIAQRRTVQADYKVTITGLPTDANKGATLRPQATHLELQCGDTTQKLDNYQYPVRKTFKWSPDSCGDVLFRIEVGKLELVKRYTGSYAFPKFLQDFKTGQRIFRR
ncbi:MAG: type VI secretion protein IcmF/TssM N-terminal domain-containing protein, partial [Desulfatiglandaceae bacterium]